MWANGGGPGQALLAITDPAGNTHADRWAFLFQQIALVLAISTHSLLRVNYGYVPSCRTGRFISILPRWDVSPALHSGRCILSLSFDPANLNFWRFIR